MLLLFVFVLQVEQVNLAGLDRVLVAYAAGTNERSLLLRQYKIAFKKSGTKVRWLLHMGLLQSSSYGGAYACLTRAEGSKHGQRVQVPAVPRNSASGAASSLNQTGACVRHFRT
jgi:hypothetical protein